ncbi:MAG: hypothetical protein PUP92_08270, partial [Rhizonema sp. PD38]|nr:hypothetical protein [Rhizonema sp. PD38]
MNCERTRVRSLARALDINFNYDLDNYFNLTVSVDRELIRTLKRFLLGLSPIQHDYLIEQHLQTFHNLQPELLEFRLNHEKRPSTAELII